MRLSEIPSSNNDYSLSLINGSSLVYTIAGAECNKLIQQATSWLISDYKINKTAKVMVLVKNSPAFMVIDFALMNTGAVSFPVSYTISKNELKNIIEEVKPHLIITEEEIKKEYESVTSGYTVATINSLDKHTWPFYNFNTVNPDNTIETCDEEPYTVIYTSGTTEQPKGVMLSSNAVLHNVVHLAQGCYVPSGKNVISVLPLNHIFERVFSYIFITQGLNIMYVNNKELLFESLSFFKPYTINCVPLLLEQILVKSATTGLGLKQLLGGEMAHICCGSSKMNIAIAQKYVQNGITILEGYGLTEMSPIIAYNRLNDFKLGSVGKPLENTLVKISNEGEILVNGKGMFKGYYLNQTATNNKIDNGFLCTGDMGYFDDDGYLYISGRYADTFKLSNGKYFNPVPVETVVQDSFSNINKCIIIKGEQKVMVLCFLNNKIDLPTELSYETEIRKLIAGNSNPLINASEIIFSNISLTINSGLLTSTLKVRRYAVRNYFNNQIIMFEKYPLIARIFFSIIEDRNKTEELKLAETIHDLVAVIENTANLFKLNVYRSDIESFFQHINNLNKNTLHVLSEVELLKGKNNNCFNDK